MRDFLNGRWEKTFDCLLQTFSGSILKILMERKKNAEWEHSSSGARSEKSERNGGGDFDVIFSI